MNKITYPSGRAVNITRATDSLITQVATAPSGGSSTTLASSMTYRPMHGPLAALTYGNGLALARTIGQNYKLIGISVTGASAATLNLTIYRDNAYWIENITNNASTGRGASYGYTPSGRLSNAKGPWGKYDYAYDGAGNLVERDVTPSGGSKTYTLNRLRRRTTGSADRPIRTVRPSAGCTMAQAATWCSTSGWGPRPTATPTTTTSG